MAIRRIELKTGVHDRPAIEEFLIREAGLLDDARFDEWRDLFAEDGYYWVPLRPGQSGPDSESSLFYDDRTVMRRRFDRLAHPRCLSQTHRTCRIIGNVSIDEVDEARGECLVRSSMIMADYQPRSQRVFAGKVRHRLRCTGDGYRIVYKRVDLINCDDTLDLVTVPF